MTLIEIPPVVFRLKPDAGSAPSFDAEVAAIASRNVLAEPKEGLTFADASAEFAHLQQSFDLKYVQEVRVGENGQLMVKKGDKMVLMRGVGGLAAATAGTSEIGRVRGRPDLANGARSGCFGGMMTVGGQYYVTPAAGQYAVSAPPPSEGLNAYSAAPQHLTSGDYYNTQEWAVSNYDAMAPSNAAGMGGGTVSVQNAVTNPMEQEMYPPGFYDNRYVSADVTIEGQQGQDYFVDGMQQVRRRPEMSRMSSKRALLLAQAGGDDDEDDGSDLEDGEMENGKYPCSMCKKRFGDPASARRHERSHRKRSSGPIRRESKSNTYKCNLCQQRFSAGYTLKKHIRVHTREKPFSCDLCNEKFSQWGNLRLHMQRHLGINPYRCPYCDKAYIAPSKLEVHIRGHTNERPYGCDVCCSNFKSNDDLRKHMMIHCNYKPFTCWICQKSFMQPSKLKQHMKEKHTLDIDVCKKDVTDRGVEYQIKILPNQANSAAAFAAAAAAAAVTAAQKATSGANADEAFAAASAASGQGLFDGPGGNNGETGAYGAGGFYGGNGTPGNNLMQSYMTSRTIYTPSATIVLADEDDDEDSSSGEKYQSKPIKRAKRPSKSSSGKRRH